MRLLPLVLLIFAIDMAHGEEKAAPPVVKDLPSTVRVTREPDAATLTPSDRQFVVTCCIHGEGVSFSLPEIILRDGERVTVADTSTDKHVVAHKLENGIRTPIVREVTEGTTARFTVISVDDTQVVVDARLTFTRGPHGMNAERRENHGVSEGRRILEVVALGEAIACPLGAKGRIEIIVKAK